MVTDLDYNITLLNDAAIKASDNWPPPPGKGLKCHELFHASSTACEFPDETCPLERIRDTGIPVKVEHEHRSANGEARSLEIIAAPLKDADGRITGMVESVPRYNGQEGPRTAEGRLPGHGHA